MYFHQLLTWEISFVIKIVTLPVLYNSKMLLLISYNTSLWFFLRFGVPGLKVVANGKTLFDILQSSLLCQ